MYNQSTNIKHGPELKKLFVTYILNKMFTQKYAYANFLKDIFWVEVRMFHTVWVIDNSV